MFVKVCLCSARVRVRVRVRACVRLCVCVTWEKIVLRALGITCGQPLRSCGQPLHHAFSSVCDLGEIVLRALGRLGIRLGIVVWDGLQLPHLFGVYGLGFRVWKTSWHSRLGHCDCHHDDKQIRFKFKFLQTPIPHFSHSRWPGTVTYESESRLPPG